MPLLASAERRFMLLLACAAVALTLLGTLLGHNPRSLGLDPSAAQASRDTASPALAARVAAPEPGAILQPLLEVTLHKRFPAIARYSPLRTPLLNDSQIVSYYGSLYTADMGILGTAGLETIITQVEDHAARYDELNGSAGVIPAIHLVYAVAQYHPTDNGLYLQYVDDSDLHRLLDLTRQHNMLLFIDLQIGRSSVEAELTRVLPFLREPNVHLALDPEFAVTGGQVPGLDLGSLHAEDIDLAQATLQRLVDEEGLPPKLLVVHQFADSMVVDGDAIGRYPDVALVIDMDGFGLADVKRSQYERYANQPYASRAAIKLFFDYDPDLMSESDVLALEPRPAVVIYQ
jgi:hypothetical protein